MGFVAFISEALAAFQLEPAFYGELRVSYKPYEILSKLSPKERDLQGWVEGIVL